MIQFCELKKYHQKLLLFLLLCKLSSYYAGVLGVVSFSISIFPMHFSYQFLLREKKKELSLCVRSELFILDLTYFRVLFSFSFLSDSRLIGEALLRFLDLPTRELIKSHPVAFFCFGAPSFVLWAANVEIYV